MDDDDTTVPGIRRSPSVEARALAGISLALNKLADECGPLAGAWDQLPPDERRVAARAFARKYRELGDIGHEIARALEDIANS